MNMIKQESFFGSWNKENKQYWIDTMQEHQDADRLMQGDWFRVDSGGDFKGCFFGCAMQTEDDTLDKATEAMGLPEWLILLAEGIFEGLPREDALEFPVNLLKSIPVDTELSIVKHKIAVLRLTLLAKNNPKVSEVIENVIKLHQKVIDGVDVSVYEWVAAEKEARLVARLSVWSAARAAEESARAAVYSAVRAAARAAARSAAYSARAAAERSVTDSASWKQEYNNLIKTLEEAYK